jgi:ornithine carbamoyltransferase
MREHNMPAPRHFLDLADLTPAEAEHLFDEAARHKEHHRLGLRSLPLAGRVLGLVFEKPSLRTRVSFQAAAAQLGGASIYMSGVEAGLGTRESIADFARVMSSYVDAVVLRTFQHHTVEAFAANASCPVINGLSDQAHPCQALADLFTIREHLGALEGKRVVFVGDGNNMARSLAVGCALLGVHFDLAGPAAYFFDHGFLARFKKRFPQTPTPKNLPLLEAVAQADVVYTDVWTSMGQEEEREARLEAFEPYQLNAGVRAALRKDAAIMHCLPAHRGEEITDDVLDSTQSIVFTQAANRLHVQKALLLWLLEAVAQPGARSW